MKRLVGQIGALFVGLTVCTLALAQDNPFYPNPVLLLKYGTMTTDLDAAHHKILNLDTSNLPGGNGITNITMTGTAALAITGSPCSGPTCGFTLTLDGDLEAIAALTGTNTIYYRSGTNVWSPVTIGTNLTFSSGTLSATTGGSGTNAFGTIHVSGQSDVVASAAPDAFTMAAGSNITITTNAGTKTVTITGSAGATHSVTLFVDGSGSPITTGVRNPVKAPYAGTLQGWSMMCKPSGSITLDVQRAANGGGLPVTSIVGGGTKPAVAAGVENASSSFAGWTSTTVATNDNFAINPTAVDGVVTYCEITLYYQ